MPRANAVDQLASLAAALRDARAAVERSEPDRAGIRIEAAVEIAGDLRTLLADSNEEIRHVALSPIAYRTVCGLIQPSDVIDADWVFAPDGVWAELRSVFPVGEAVEGDVGTEPEESLFTVVGTYTDSEEDGEPQRFGETVLAISAEEAEQKMRAENPTLLVAGVLSGGLEVVR